MVLLSLCLIFGLTSYHAEAAPFSANHTKIDAIGISISKSCLLSDICATYKKIHKLDNAPPTIGKLVEKDGTISRKYTTLNNNAEWLRFYNGVIVVDPPPNIIPRIKMIHIVPQLDVYIAPGQYKLTSYNASNYNATTDAAPTQNVRVSSHTRYVNDNCREATITAKDLKTVLIDTIKYMQHNCDPNHTKLKTTTDTITPKTKHDVSTSYKSKAAKWLDTIKQDCLKKRNACTNLQQPTRGGL